MSFGGDGVKSTWVTRRIPTDLPVTWGRLQAPRVGDLVLCEVLSIGIHGRAETVTGGRAKLYPGDQIVCAVGNRYATSLLEALADVGEDHVDLISASGLCGRVINRSKKATIPTSLRPVGQAFLGGLRVNLSSFVVAEPSSFLSEPQWIVVVGSAMDSGKTTACAAVIHGLVAAGNRVGAVKLTGTASARDFGSFRDAGASPVLDFLDVGWPSTVGCTSSELIAILTGTAKQLRAEGVDWGVIEIADGVLQSETTLLLEALATNLGPFALVVTTRESLAAVAAVDLLAGMGLEVAAISGLITNSPLACREVELARAVHCVPTFELGRRFARNKLAAPRNNTAPPVGTAIA